MNRDYKKIFLTDAPIERKKEVSMNTKDKKVDYTKIINDIKDGSVFYATKQEYLSFDNNEVKEGDYKVNKVTFKIRTITSKEGVLYPVIDYDIYTVKGIFNQKQWLPNKMDFVGLASKKTEFQKQQLEQRLYTTDAMLITKDRDALTHEAQVLNIKRMITGALIEFYNNDKPFGVTFSLDSKDCYLRVKIVEKDKYKKYLLSLKNETTKLRSPF